MERFIADSGQLRTFHWVPLSTVLPVSRLRSSYGYIESLVRVQDQEPVREIRCTHTSARLASLRLRYRLDAIQSLLSTLDISTA